jgi:hypothetical protein
VVFAENLREKPPDRDLRSEHAVSEFDLMIVENRLDTRLGKHLGEGQTFIVRKPPAQIVECHHNQSFVLWLTRSRTKRKELTRIVDMRTNGTVKTHEMTEPFGKRIAYQWSERRTPHETDPDLVAPSRSRLHEVQNGIKIATH